jgi:hypothetical protein
MLLSLCLGALPCLEIGCGGTKALPDVAIDPYVGPPVSLDGSGDSYVVLVRAPTPGWVATLDRVAEQYKHMAIFVTLRQPNPAYYYPENQVEQRLGTSVVSTDAVTLYARTLAYDQPAGNQAYARAAQTRAITNP